MGAGGDLGVGGALEMTDFNSRGGGMVAWGRVLLLFLKGPGFKFLFVLGIMVCDFPKVGVWDGLTKVVFLEY